MDQLETLIIELRRMLILIHGAPNANYDVELILPNMKNFSVIKRYFMPLKGLLPVIPQVSIIVFLFFVSLLYSILNLDVC